MELLERVYCALGTMVPICHLMLVVAFNKLDMALHNGIRRTLERKARRANGDTEVRDLTARDIVHEPYGGQLGRGNYVVAIARTMDEHGLERSTITTRPFPTGGRAIAPGLFRVESIPMLRGPS